MDHLVVAPCAGAWIETTCCTLLAAHAQGSPPARGRGLKPCTSTLWVAASKVAPCAGAWIETPPSPWPPERRSSPPARGRGLKRQVLKAARAGADVAPCAGAWIETAARRRSARRPSVAPCAGAWIETATSPTTPPWCGSPPARGRGLKHLHPPPLDPPEDVAPCAGAWIETFSPLQTVRRHRVAPCAGAWIETTLDPLRRPCGGSPPARGRGLKLPPYAENPCGPTSPPARGRGLKHAEVSALADQDESPPARGRGLKRSATPMW